MIVAFLEAALRKALGDASLRIADARAVGGGCMHETARLSTRAGEFFAKWNARCPPDLFLCEAKGLEALRAAGSEIVLPRVVAASASGWRTGRRARKPPARGPQGMTPMPWSRHNGSISRSSSR